MEGATGYDYSNQEGSLISAEALERSRKRRESVQGWLLLHISLIRGYMQICS